MTIYTCDRCGKESFIKGEIKQLDVAQLEVNKYTSIKKLDVCLPCLNLIKLFISEVYYDE